MPQPKQPATRSNARGAAAKAPPVRGDATTTPAAAVAPGASTEAAVAATAAPEKAAARKAAPKRAPAKPASRGAAAAKPAAAKPASAKPASGNAKPKRPAARPKAAPAGRAASPRPKAPAKPKPAAKPRRAPASRSAATPAPAPEPTSAAARDEALKANMASLRDLLAGGVVLTAQRLQETVDEAVTRGRITRHDAEELAGGLLAVGRQQTQDLLAELEQLLDRGRNDLDSARSITKGAVKGSSERLLQEVDRARRVAGLGPSFPILGYDELSASQVKARLGGLSKAELRQVRSYEKKHEKRASVLKAVKKALG